MFYPRAKAGPNLKTDDALADTSIHIALCFDDNFWAPAYATMRSVCLATHRRKDLNFHLCHRTLTDEHVADLKKIATEFGSVLHFYALDEMEMFREVALKAKYHKRLTHTIYARLMFDHFLPSEISRLIYLDCDTYVRAPLEQLAELDMQGKALAAVEDYFADFVTNGRDLTHNRDLFDPADPYFNSGMLVIDMDRWRNYGVIERLESMIADGTMDRIYYDQDFLNLTFKGDWLGLDPLWNTLDPRPPHQALNPHILHFTGNSKPWNLLSGVAFARLYRHVMTNELFYRYWRHRVKRRLRKLVGLK